MKTVTIQELQKSAHKILRLVQAGQSVQVTKNKRVVALISLPQSDALQLIKRPDFKSRLKLNWGARRFPVTGTELIRD
jgi:antitoxin (DNA-binding transcriptional repressor) of toxin-antitoxin stability system